MSSTDVLDLLAVICLVAFALLLWPPAALVVVALACLAISWQRSRGSGDS